MAVKSGAWNAWKTWLSKRAVHAHNKQGVGHLEHPTRNNEGYVMLNIMASASAQTAVGPMRYNGSIRQTLV